MSIASFTDSVSEGYGFNYTCGPLKYSVLEPGDKFVNVTHEPDSAIYKLIIDTSEYTNTSLHTVTIAVELLNYPDVPKA